MVGRWSKQGRLWNTLFRTQRPARVQSSDGLLYEPLEASEITHSEPGLNACIQRVATGNPSTQDLGRLAGWILELRRSQPVGFKP